MGEVKSEQKTRPAAKIAHHERGDIILEIRDEEFLEFLLGQWESRRFNEDDQLEIVRYIFEDNERVTLYQTLVDSDESIDPLVGTWKTEGDLGIIITWDLGWEGVIINTWTDVKLYVNEDEDLLVLDYNVPPDKELRTLNQDTSVAPGLVRNWLVELMPQGDVSIDSGKWIVKDFKIRAADGHLPNHVSVVIEGDDQVHVLSKPAYYGSEGVPHVDLCRTAGHVWQSTRTLRISIPASGEAGFFVTRCGTKRATINIYAPEAHIGADDPLVGFRVR